MSSKRKSFVMHKDSLDILNDLSDEQAGKLFKAISAYQNNQEYELDQITKMVFLPFKNQFVRDDEKYIKTCEKRAIAGSKGGKQKVANASNSKQNIANLADSVSNSNSDSKKDNGSEYAFLGETIRLNHSDFKKWQKLYPNLNLMNELQQLDMECRGDKKWFMTVSSKLNYRNKNAPQKQNFTPRAFSQ